MSDWQFAQHDPNDQLAQLHFFSMTKRQDSQEINFTITVKEFYTPNNPALKFFAQSDKQTNQHAVPYTPSGWGKTMLEALQACIREIHRFPYQLAKSESTNA